MTTIRERIECYQTDQQREILKTICSSINPGAFYLAGGTCLSVFYFGHRKSNVLDFFSLKKTDLSELRQLFRNIASIEQTIAESQHFCSYIQGIGKG